MPGGRKLWTALDQNRMRQQNAERTSVPESDAFHEGVNDFFNKPTTYKVSVDDGELLNVRAPGTLGPDDPGNLHQYRDPRIGTPEWYAEHHAPAPERWIERLEPDPNTEGFTSVVVDGESGVVHDDTRGPITVSTRDKSLGTESRMGAVEDSS